MLELLVGINLLLVVLALRESLRLDAEIRALSEHLDRLEANA